MKAITLTQPWASLVALGLKKIETRGWRTDHRGPLAIHAAKGFPKWASDLVRNDWEFFGAFHPERAASLKSAGVRLIPSASGHQAAAELPLGAVVATCQLVACWKTELFRLNGLVSQEEFDSLRNSGSPYRGGTRIVTAEMTDRERAFGDYSPGRWAWVLEDVKPLAVPVPAKGALSLWEWTPPNA